MGGSCPLSLPSNAERRAHCSARVFSPANRKEERGRVSDLLSKLEQCSMQSMERRKVPVQSMEEESLECTVRFSIHSVGDNPVSRRREPGFAAHFSIHSVVIGRREPRICCRSSDSLQCNQSKQGAPICCAAQFSYQTLGEEKLAIAAQAHCCGTDGER